METTNLLKNIRKMKRHGDTVYIARTVNAKRKELGMKNISPAYVGYMLNGVRTMLPEVAEVASEYYKAQEQFEQKTMV